MSTGWPQNQQDLRWPSVDGDDRPGTRPAAEEHPSGPLPVGRSQQRGRGRGRWRDADQAAEPENDEDYDWIRYLGAAGPAQEPRRGPDSPQAGRPAGQGRSSGPGDSWRTAASPTAESAWPEPAPVAGWPSALAGQDGEAPRRRMPGPFSARRPASAPDISGPLPVVPGSGAGVRRPDVSGPLPMASGPGAATPGVRRSAHARPGSAVESTGPLPSMPIARRSI